MRQRNDTGHAQTVMAWPTEQDPDRRPFQVGAGEETDFPEPLAGFTALDPPAEGQGAPEPGSAATAEPAKPKTTRSSKDAASAAEGSEPQ